MTSYLVGDIQGCDQPLERLLAHLDFSPSRDRLCVLGDLVNRGPDSLPVLRRLHAMGNAVACVLGNHDLHLLAVYHGIRPQRPDDSLHAILAAPDAPLLMDWLRQQPLARLEQGCLMVHAGVLPQWSAQQTLALAAEVQAALRGPQLLPFLRDMYGSRPTRWQPSLQGADRLRVIVNALTRMRYCSADGEMEFASKDGPGQAPPGFMPWFDVPQRQSANTPVAFGHWSTLGLLRRPNLAGLDTGCVWGGCLSALPLQADGSFGAVVQVPCPQAQKPG